MKSTRITPLLITILAMIFVTAYYQSAKTDHDEMIEAIIAQPQIEAHQHSHQLAALSPSSVPHIAKALLNNPKFPMTFYRALVQIGDKRAVPPLLEFLAKTPLSDGIYVNVDARHTILALGTFADQRAVMPLDKILQNVDGHMGIRLAAATALANISDGLILNNAREFILDKFKHSAEFYQKPNEGFVPSQMIEALIAVNTLQSLKILITQITNGVTSYLALPIVKYMETKNTKQVTDTLIFIADHPRAYEMHVRLTAIEALQSMTHQIPTAKMHSYLDEFINQQNEGQFYDDLRSRAKALKQQLKLNVGAT